MTDRNRITRRKRITQRWQRQHRLIIAIMKDTALDSDKMTLLLYSEVEHINATYQGDDGMILQFVMSGKSRNPAKADGLSYYVNAFIKDPKAFEVAFGDFIKPNEYYKLIIKSDGGFELRTRSCNRQPSAANLTKQAREDIHHDTI